MDMRHLRCFVAVAETLHFGRAAQRLHLTQPPVSLAIKELEAELGVRLLERSSRRIALTRAGEDALHDARSVLAAADVMRRRAQQTADALAGPVSIGFISLPAYSFLPALLRQLGEDCPRVQPVLLEGTTDQILHDVEIGALDVGLVFRTPVLPASVRQQTVQTEALVVALPEAHALARRTRVPVAALAGERFLGFERHQGALMYDAIVATCVRHGFSPRMLPARQMHTIVSLVSGGLGVALVPACVQALGRQGVVYRPLQGERATVETVAVWRDGERSPAVAAVLARLPSPAAGATRASGRLRRGG